MNNQKDLVRRETGWKSRQSGVAFESWLKRSFNKMNWHLEKINDGCRSSGIGGKKLIRVRQPFDFVGAGPENRVIFFDAKFRSNTETISRSVLGLSESSIRKRVGSATNQIESLERFAHFGHLAGFMVYLSAIDIVYWIASRWAIINPDANKIKIGSFAKGLDVHAINELYFNKR